MAFLALAGTGIAGLQDIVLFKSSDTATSSANAAAVITYPAQGAGATNIIYGIAFSYSAAPTNGTLKVEDGSGNVVFGPIVPTAGAGPIYFNPGLVGSGNTAMIITLSAGGSGVVGHISILGHRP